MAGYLTNQILLKEAYRLRDKLQEELRDDYFNKTLLGHQYHIHNINEYINQLLNNNMSVLTQKFLNYIFPNSEETVITNKGVEKVFPLSTDGVIGVKTLRGIQLGLSFLQNEFAKRNWIWDKQFNFIGIRVDSDFDDTFEDWFVLTVYDTIVAVPASTVAGVVSVWKYLNLWIRGRAGVGTIMENQQIDYLLVEPKGDSWTGWTGNKGFLFQDKPINVYRGAIQDGGKWVIDKTNSVIGDIGGGFNVHTWAGFSIWTVQNLSEGCNVTREEYWNVIFPILVKNARIENGQKRITYSLIQL